jgi:hypothetical protein
MTDDPTEPRPMSEADQRFADRLAEDLSRILGTGILIDRLDFGDAGEAPSENGDDGGDGPARIRVICLFDGRAETLEAEGETRLEAYNRLVIAAAEFRLGLAARNMIAPG